MQIAIIAVAHKAPEWVDSGFRDYQSRIRGGIAVSFRRVAPGRSRRGVPLRKRLEDEAQRLRKALPKKARSVALDRRGAPMSTERLATQLEAAMRDGVDLAYLIGGADGLDDALVAQADAVWSLGESTFPHHLVRILVAEQVYRAWTTLHNLPYHHGH